MKIGQNRKSKQIVAKKFSSKETEYQNSLTIENSLENLLIYDQVEPIN
jgi:hypothetical protein